MLCWDTLDYAVILAFHNFQLRAVKQKFRIKCFLLIIVWNTLNLFAISSSLKSFPVWNRNIKMDVFFYREGRGGREEDPNAGRSDQDTEWRRGPAPPPRDDDR